MFFEWLHRQRLIDELTPDQNCDWGLTKIGYKMQQHKRLILFNIEWDKKDHRYWDDLPSQILSDLEMCVLDIIRANLSNIVSYDVVLVEDYFVELPMAA